MINGIDVSKHNGTIDWTKVKAAGKDFAMIRLGWAGYDGRIVANGGLDPMFEANAKGAIAAGLDIGVYVYSYCKTASAAKVAAQETVELIKDYVVTYPVAFDIEDSLHHSMQKSVNTAIAGAFLLEIEQAGYYSMLYTYKSFAESYLNMADLSRYDFWLAHFTTKTDYTGSYGIWQHSETGKVGGVTGNVDLDIAYMDYAAVIMAAGLNGFSGSESDDIVEDLEQKGEACEHEEELEMYRATLDKIRELVDGVR